MKKRTLSFQASVEIQRLIVAERRRLELESGGNPVTMADAIKSLIRHGVARINERRKRQLRAA